MLPAVMTTLVLAATPTDAGASAASSPASAEQDLIEYLSSATAPELTFTWSASGHWAAFGSEGQRSVCVESAGRAGCVRLGARESVPDVMEEAKRRLGAGDVAPIPPALSRLFELLPRASAATDMPASTQGFIRPIVFSPLVLMEDRVAKIAGADENEAAGLGWRVLTGFGVRLAKPTTTGWAFLDDSIHGVTYASAVAKGIVPGRSVLLLVNGFQSEGSGMAEGSAFLSVVDLGDNRALRLLAKKHIGRWSAVDKGWAVGGPTSQTWLWPRVMDGRLRLEPAAPPTRWLRRGWSGQPTRRAAGADRAIASEAGDWCWTGEGLARCQAR